MVHPSAGDSESNKPLASSKPRIRKASHLRSHRGRKFDQQEGAVERRPIEYAPSSEPVVNLERLPPPGALDDMELAFREQPLSENEMLAISDNCLGWLIIAPALMAMVLIVVLPIMSWSFCFSIVGAVTAYVFWTHVLRQGISPLKTLFHLTWPVTCLILCKGSAVMLNDRVFAGLAFSALAALAFHKQGSRPFQFYAQWLLAHPRLKPETRKKNKFKPTGIDFGPLVMILLFGVGAPSFLPLWISQLLTFFIIFLYIATSVSYQQNFSLRRFQKYVIDLRIILAYYLCYGLFSSGAPGVWQPRSGLTKRNRRLMLSVVPLSLALTASLAGFFPWNFPWVRAQVLAVCTDTIAVDEDALFYFQRMTPNLNWKDLPSQSTGEPPTIPQVRSYGLPSQMSQRQRNQYEQALAIREAAKKDLAAFEAKANSYEERVRDFFDNALSTTTNTWAAVAIMGILSGNVNFLWCFIVALFLSFLCTSGMLLVLCYRPVAAMREHAAQLAELDNDDRTEWQWYVDRLRSSQHVAQDPLGPTIRERNHLFLGVQPQDDFPILLDKQLLSEHCYIVGDSGSGKTSLGLMPMLMQLIRGNTSGEKPPAVHTESKAEPPSLDEQMPPLVILDLKGDMALFNTIRHEAESRKPGSFLYFTPEKGQASCYFNPFENMRSESRTLIQLCNLFLDSLSLNHGEGYGRSYYSRRSRFALIEALEKEPQLNSFQELYDSLMRSQKKEEGPSLRDTFELIAAIHALTFYPQLNVVGNQPYPQRCIHMPTLLEERQVAYFWLPAAMESVSVKEIAKLALYSLMTAAIDRQRQGKEVRQTYLVIDEFQRVAAENFKIILEQARSFGIGAILANQTRADLKLHDMDLRPTINTNTRVKQFFSVTDSFEMAELTKVSGEELATMTAGSITDTHTVTSRGSNSGINHSFSWADAIKTRLVNNDILRISDHPLDSILQVSRGSGYTQFGGGCVHVRSTWATTEETYKAMQRLPWPDPSTQPEVERPTDEPTVIKSDETPQGIDKKVRQGMESAMSKLFDRLEQQYKYDESS